MKLNVVQNHVYLIFGTNQISLKTIDLIRVILEKY